jgi:hypothetical protein
MHVRINKIRDKENVVYIIDIVEYYSAIKKGDFLTFATT